MTIIYITEIIFTSPYSLPTVFTIIIIIIIVILHKNDQRAGDGEIKILLLLLLSTNEHDKCARGG
jgi:hypothetical protein